MAVKVAGGRQEEHREGGKEEMEVVAGDGGCEVAGDGVYEFLGQDAAPAPITCCKSQRHVVLPPEVANLLPKNRLLSEVDVNRELVKVDRGVLVKGYSTESRRWLNEWRAIGVQQSRGWVQYAVHRPEPHIMLFRRPLNYQQQQENQSSIMAK
ncbi:hypothetical protein KSS87_015749 [Heliosperma pusillum]|nr:hypothetical protein KSS87_015749 [Heliosperma pusillum]